MEDSPDGELWTKSIEAEHGVILVLSNEKTGEAFLKVSGGRNLKVIFKDWVSLHNSGASEMIFTDANYGLAMED